MRATPLHRAMPIVATAVLCLDALARDCELVVA